MTYPQPSSSPSAPVPLQDGSQEPDELTRFRDDWKHEVGLHHRAEATTHEPSVDLILTQVDGLPANQHYSAEELPQAQDSFVRLPLEKPRLFNAEDFVCRRPSSTFSSVYTSQRKRTTRAPSKRALYPTSSSAFHNPSHSNARKKQNPCPSRGSRMKCSFTSSGSWITEPSNDSLRSVARPASSP